jgi:hypothetical protein
LERSSKQQEAKYAAKNYLKEIIPEVGMYDVSQGTGGAIAQRHRIQSWRPCLAPGFNHKKDKFTLTEQGPFSYFTSFSREMAIKNFPMPVHVLFLNRLF